MRCATVASGTRKALAISAVDSPPTARSVSASCDGGDSDGWQHRNSSASVSSRSGSASGSRGRRTASASSRRLRALSLLNVSTSRRLATVSSHERGLSGRPSTGHRRDAASSASCTASSHASNCPWRRTSAPRTCGASSRSRSSVSVTWSLGGVRSALQLSDVELLHLEHGSHRSLRPPRVGVADEFQQPGGDDLPREAEPVLQPPALALLPAVGGERVPEVVDLILGVAAHEERERLGELVVRPAVQRDQAKSLELERHDHRGPRLAGPGLAVAGDLHDLRLARGRAGPALEDVEVQRGGLLGLVVEPQVRGDLLGHLEPPQLVYSSGGASITWRT